MVGAAQQWEQDEDENEHETAQPCTLHRLQAALVWACTAGSAEYRGQLGRTSSLPFPSFPLPHTLL